MSGNRQQIQTVEQAIAYLTGGRGRATVVSKRTGRRFTYRFSTPRGPRQRGSEKPIFVAVLWSRNNERDYRYLGNLWGIRYAHGRRSTVHSDAKSAAAIGWLMKQLGRGRLPQSVELWHEGRCAKCGRRLTVPASIERGIGPQCAQREESYAV